jgi:hypothetical protein
VAGPRECGNELHCGTVHANIKSSSNLVQPTILNLSFSRSYKISLGKKNNSEQRKSK